MFLKKGKKFIIPQPPATANASWNQLLILRGSERFEAICNGLYDCFETLSTAKAAFAGGSGEASQALNHLYRQNLANKSQMNIYF